MQGTQAADHPRPTTWLNRNVVGMGLSSFLSDLGHEAATAVLPAFLATLGATPAVLGMIEGTADAVASFTKLGAGWYSDKLGHRKAIATGGYVLTGVSKALFAFATTYHLVLVGRVVGWFGRGVRGPLRDAMLAESVPAEAWGRAFGFHRAGDTLGAILGPLAAFFLVSAVGYRTIFLLTLLPGLLSAVAFGTLVQERRRPGNQGLQFWRTLSSLPSGFQRFLIGVGAFGIADFAHTLLILRAITVLTPTFGPVRAGQLAILLFTWRNVIYAAAAYPIGAWSDRLGRRTLLGLGYALSALMCLGFLVPLASFWYLLGLFTLAGLYIAAEDALEGASAADFLPGEVRGIGYGVLGTVNGLGDLVSSVVVGLLWANVSVAAGFLYAAVLSTLGALVILRLR